MSEQHEEVRVEGQPDAGSATPSTTAHLEIPDFPKFWEKLTAAAAIGAEIILSGSFLNRKRELGIVALNIAGFAAGQVLRSNGEALTAEEDDSDYTIEDVGRELQLIASRVAPPGTNAITVPPIIRKKLVRWAWNYLKQLGDEYLAG